MVALPIACRIDGTSLAGDGQSILPLAYGADTAPNLIINGDFATDTVWTKGGGWTIGSGAASIVGNSGTLSQAYAFVVGAQYEITFTVTAYTAGAVTPRFTGGSIVNGTTRSSAGTFTQALTAATGNTTLGLLASGGSTMSVDNVILRRIR